MVAARQGCECTAWGSLGAASTMLHAVLSASRGTPQAPPNLLPTVPRRTSAPCLALVVLSPAWQSAPTAHCWQAPGMWQDDSTSACSSIGWRIHAHASHVTSSAPHQTCTQPLCPPDLHTSCMHTATLLPAAMLIPAVNLARCCCTTLPQAPGGDPWRAVAARQSTTSSCHRLLHRCWLLAAHQAACCCGTWKAASSWTA
jgi:hypothetical protein